MNHLFAGQSDCLEQLRDQAISQVRVTPDSEILNADPQWLAAKIVAGLQADPLMLGDPVMEQQEVDVDVSWDKNRYFSPGSRCTVRGVRYQIMYPVQGFLPLLHRRPSTFFSVFPHGGVSGNTLTLEYELPDFDHAEELQQRHTRQIDLIRKNVAHANADLAAVIDGLPTMIQGVIGQRQQEIRSKQQSASVLGIPFQSSGPVQKRLGAPIEQYRQAIVKPARRDPNQPVAEVEFDGILGLIEHVGRQWELFPANTQGWGEDEFRNSILGYLNLPYPGQASGETFIRNGKSDILIRDSGVEVFVGECKIWGGQAQVHSEMNQLFNRYQTWRATKAALIYFNRGRNTTDVVAHLKKLIPAHSAYISASAERGETHLRFRMRHPADPQRIFDFAVLVFAITR